MSLIYLHPSGGIAIRHVCLFVGWLVRWCVVSVFVCSLTCSGAEYLGWR